MNKNKNSSTKILKLRNLTYPAYFPDFEQSSNQIVKRAENVWITDYLSSGFAAEQAKMNPVRLHLTSKPRLTPEHVCMLQDTYQLMVAPWSLTG